MASQPIEDVVDQLLRERGSFTSGALRERTGLTRQALHRHLSRWVAEGRLVREGHGRGTRYRRGAEPSFERVYPTAGLAEDRVADELRHWLEEAGIEPSAAASQILDYVVTELVNNAIDHSGAPRVTVRWARRGDRLEGTIADEGVGALERLRAGLSLDDHLHALLELSKGKVTTQPERHTGEGIFFASKMVDRFELVANGLEWIVDDALGEQAVREVEPRPGTRIQVVLALDRRTTPEQVFRRYTHDLEFDTTRCVVRLFEHGVRFVSRSEAKRLVAGLERFREVILDFTGVAGVGQGFVDEVFRVWAGAHPDVRLVPVGMNEVVSFMVRRGWPGGRAGHERR